MRRAILKSLCEAFDHVMEHYAPFGMEEMVERSDTYAAISSRTPNDLRLSAAKFIIFS